MQPRVLIIIPAYNEDRTIADVLLGLREVVPDYDRLVVNDGSADGTERLVVQLGERQLRLPCNVGYGYALQTGMKYALTHGYDVVVCFDADGQHMPYDVPAVVQALVSSDADLVIGSRYCDEHGYSSAYARKIGQLIFSHLSRLMLGQRIYDTTSGFKAMRAAICHVLVEGAFMDFHTETLVRLKLMGFKIKEHPIMVQERAYGKSMHSTASIVQYPLKTLLLTAVAALDVLLARRTR